MAIDSKEKRQNAAGVGRPYMRHPEPVGATDEQSRIARGLGYGGNALGATASAGQTLRHPLWFMRTLLTR